LGITHFDTAELYGPYLNEKLLADALGSNRTSVEIATKFGYRIHDGKIVGLDSTPHSIRLAVEGSLRRLRRDYIDVLYQHRPDPAVPIEDVVGTMSDLVNEGKVLALGLSATDSRTLQQANALHPISFVQNEFSLIHRDPEKELLPSLRETATEFVCYSPLGRGMLGSANTMRNQRAPSDYRSKDVRFRPESLAETNDRLAPLWRISASRSVSPAAIALAWLLSKAPIIQVIPGANVEQLKINIQCVNVALTKDEVAALDLADEINHSSLR
jgi:aryl-alcohol dehydrogenase-like predicted oxidoreductase